jgi:nucleotide-binding universal stress UspA family protein
MSQINIQRILFATDFSTASLGPLPYAIAIAHHFGSKIYLAHVIPTEAFSTVPLDERDPVLENIRSHVAERMAELGAMSRLKGIPSEALVDHGDIWPVLSAMVEKYSVDLVAIGTHGRRGVDKIMVGSTAEEILRRAQIPVLIAGPETTSIPEAGNGFKHILYATDFSGESQPAMHYACSLAREYGASLAFLHVTEEIWKAELSSGMKAADFFKKRMLEENWTMEEDDISREYYFRFGLPSQRILELAAQLQSELIVLGVRGSRHPRVAAHLPGPTAYDVVSQARCPLLVIRGEHQP